MIQNSINRFEFDVVGIFKTCTFFCLNILKRGVGIWQQESFDGISEEKIIFQIN
jgi:hypothetical protein